MPLVKSIGQQSSVNYAPPEETTAILGFAGKESSLLIPMQDMMALAPETLATHLYRASEGVLACQEAMWEQLKDRVRNRPTELKELGWDDDDELEEMVARKKFETLVQRYRECVFTLTISGYVLKNKKKFSDMHHRVAPWYSLTRMGWELPPQGPLSRAEIVEEERLRQAMLDARKLATEDTQIPCRSIRVIAGVKGTG
jgi:hypothetical protein